MSDLVQELVAHYADLRRQLTRDLRDSHYAADIAQTSFKQVFAQARKSLGAGRTGSTSDAAPEEAKRNGGIESPRTLLLRVARNLCFDEASRRKVAQEWVRTPATIGTPLTAPSSEYILAQPRVLTRGGRNHGKVPTATARSVTAVPCLPAHSPRPCGCTNETANRPRPDDANRLQFQGVETGGEVRWRLKHRP